MSYENIIICAQLGAGSTEIAEIVGKKLGFEVYNTDRLLKRIAADLRISFEQLASRSSSGEIDVDAVLSAQALDILNSGKSIFEGRSSILVLLAPSRLKVLLIAPKHIRAKHVADVRGISYDQAFDEVEASDKDRSNLAMKICRINWLDPEFYDLVVNTGAWDYEEVAELIVKFYDMKGR